MLNRCIVAFVLGAPAIASAQAQTPPPLFAAQRDYPQPSIRALAVGDVNGDARSDIVMAHYTPTVTVLLSGGGRQVIDMGINNYPSAIAVAHLNADRFADVAVGNSASSTVSVLVSNGNGTFQAAQDFDAGGFPTQLAAADLTGDGRADLTVLTASDVTLLPGNGDGTFAAATLIQSFLSPLMIDVGDFTSDSKLDIAVSCEGTKVAVVPGNGNGTFLPALFTVADTIGRITGGDFNGDGKRDVAAAGASRLGVLLGNGNGTFQVPPISSPTGTGGVMTTGDFNGDSRLDLVSVGQGVQVLLGNGDGTLRPPVFVLAGGDTSSVAVADLNGDLIPDLALGSAGSPAGFLSLRYGRGDGTFFQTPGIRTDLRATTLVSVDFNKDGKADLALGLEESIRRIVIILGNGDGTFQPAPAVLTLPGLIEGLAAADVDADSNVDLIAAHDGTPPALTVFRGNGDGTFGTGQSTSLGRLPVHLVAGDFNQDGKADVEFGVSASFGYPGAIFILLGKGDGTFVAAPSPPVGLAPYSAVVTDLNRDGRQDLAVANSGDDTLSVLLGNGDGTFQVAPRVPAGNQPEGLAAGDFNGDGNPDLAVASPFTYDVRVTLGKGDGTMQPATRYILPNSPNRVGVADLNGDGFLDIAVPLEGSTLMILNGIGDGRFETQWVAFSTLRSPFALVFADFTMDGKTDIAVAGDGRTSFDQTAIGVALLYNKRP